MPNPKTLKFVIPGEVVTSEMFFELADGSTVSWKEYKRTVVPSKKNDRRIAVNKTTMQAILLPSAQHEDWHKVNLPLFRAWADKLIRDDIRLPIVRCKAKLIFYFPDGKRRDLTNKAETIFDILTDSGILYDDDFKIMGPASLKGFINRSKPRTEIYLTILTPDMDEYEVDLTPEEYYTERKLRKNLRRRIIRQQKKASANKS